MLVPVLALLAVSAAPEANSAAPATAPAAPVAKEKKICVTQDAVIGSITTKRVCKTKAEWDAAAGRSPQPPANQQNQTPANGAND
jgi:hypothetical protein